MRRWILVVVLVSCGRPSAPAPKSPIVAPVRDAEAEPEAPREVVLEAMLDNPIAAPRDAFGRPVARHACLDEGGPCEEAAKLPRCTDKATITRWDELQARRDELVATTIVIEGRLVQSSLRCTLVACVGGGCCNTCSATLAVESDLGQVAIDATQPQLRCEGDESQSCCTHAVEGQRVRVRGVLRGAVVSRDAPWDRGGRLEDASVCTQ